MCARETCAAHGVEWGHCSLHSPTRSTCRGSVHPSDGASKLSPQLEAARGALLIFTNDRPRARIALTNALARGYRPALAALSSLQRLEGEPRDALLELSERDLDACDDFERANLEREVGLLHEERDAPIEARSWLERAWRTAQLGTYGSGLTGEAMGDSGLFDLPALGRLVDDHAAGTADHSQALWQLLVMEGFLRQGARGDASAEAQLIGT